MPFRVFRSIFAVDPHRIQVQLNWSLLQELADAADGRVRVEVVELSPEIELAALFAPFYRTADDGDVRWDAEGARPCSGS